MWPWPVNSGGLALWFCLRMARALRLYEPDSQTLNLEHYNLPEGQKLFHFDSLTGTHGSGDSPINLYARQQGGGPLLSPPSMDETAMSLCKLLETLKKMGASCNGPGVENNIINSALTERVRKALLLCGSKSPNMQKQSSSDTRQNLEIKKAVAFLQKVH